MCRCLHTSRHLRHFSTLLSRITISGLLNIVVHNTSYVRKLKKVQMLLYQTSREIIILFSTFYTGLLLLFRKKNWALPLLRHCFGVVGRDEDACHPCSHEKYLR